MVVVSSNSLMTGVRWLIAVVTVVAIVVVLAIVLPIMWSRCVTMSSAVVLVLFKIGVVRFCLGFGSVVMVVVSIV